MSADEIESIDWENVEIPDGDELFSIERANKLIEEFTRVAIEMEGATLLDMEHACKCILAVSSERIQRVFLEFSKEGGDEDGLQEGEEA